jgi:hypothetical protein
MYDKYDSPYQNTIGQFYSLDGYGFVEQALEMQAYLHFML